MSLRSRQRLSQPSRIRPNLCPKLGPYGVGLSRPSRPYTRACRGERIVTPLYIRDWCGHTGRLGQANSSAGLSVPTSAQMSGRPGQIEEREI